MKTYTREELNLVLSEHLLWLKGQDGGERSDLRLADLREANLRLADLRLANLSGADLSGADLRLAKDGAVCRMDFGGWSICIRSKKTSIGCQEMDNDFWLQAEPNDVSLMASSASELWGIHGDAVKSAIKVVMNKSKSEESK